MIGECRDIKYWEDMNGVNPQIGDHFIDISYWGIRILKIISFKNLSCNMRIEVKEFGDEDHYYMSFDKQDFSRCEIISKFHPKYKEIK